jgi:anti-repressor protein
MDLTVFTYTDQQVRTVLIDGDPWFVASDVARVLGYRDAHNLVRRLDEDDRGTRSMSTPSGEQQMTVITEAGLYVAVLGSQVHGARDFKRWVTREVLPQIRRTGSYGGQIAQMPLSEQLALAAEAARRAEELEALRAIDAPKVDAFEAFMDADGAYTMDAAAKSLTDVTGGMGRNRLFSWLRDRGVLMPGNRPYQQYAHLFKVVVGSYERDGISHTTYTTYVRPTGLDAIRRWFTKELV